MCDYEIAGSEASTICRQLGYTSGTREIGYTTSRYVSSDGNCCMSASLLCVEICWPFGNLGIFLSHRTQAELDASPR